MTVRRRRKKNKLRGKRTHGAGDTKNRRGAGNKGGRGKAGSHKHKFSKYYGLFGTEKKKVMGKPKPLSLNIENVIAMLPLWEKEGKVEKNGGVFVLDGKKVGIGKILGRGQIGFPLYLKNIKASSQALAKIEKAKGRVLAENEEFELGDEEE